MKRAAILLALVLSLATILTACGTGSTTTGASHGQNNGNHTQTPVSTDGTTSPSEGKEEPAKQKLALDIFFADPNLTKLESEKREIEYTAEAEKYELAMKQLGKPEQPGHEPLWEGFQYHSIRFDSATGRLTIDAKSDNQYNIGSTGESYALDALKKTMFQFPEVKEIAVLVDGKPAETLMGHEDISQPFKR